MAEAIGLIESFYAVHGGDALPQQNSICRWLPPLPGWVKVNCDATLQPGFQGEGLGCCIRDHDGRLLRATSCFFGTYSSILLSELKATA